MKNPQADSRRSAARGPAKSDLSTSTLVLNAPPLGAIVDLGQFMREEVFQAAPSRSSLFVGGGLGPANGAPLALATQGYQMSLEQVRQGEGEPIELLMSITELASAHDAYTGNAAQSVAVPVDASLRHSSNLGSSW